MFPLLKRGSWFGTEVVQSCIAVLQDDWGVTAIEYGLIAALISVAIVTVLSTVGTNLSSTFSTIAGDL